MSISAATDDSEVEDAHQGRILDERYRLDEVIGVGAIGKVYAATQLTVERKVAVKLLHASLRERDLSAERFLREAKAVARLSHSNCLTLFDFGSCDNLGCFYMVTEFVEGQTLAKRMHNQMLPVDEVYYILYQITSALEHAHARGILHRDLKPENIMLVGQQTDYPRVKVLDFGLARIREEATQPREPEEAAGESAEATDSRLTNFGELNGTPAYMSPEQCRGELDLTPACDYYALGVLAYELFEGKLPFEASQVPELLSKHLNDPIPPMESGRAPDEIEEMICRLLAKKPDFRLRDPADIIDALRPYVALEPSHEFSASTLDRLRREAFGDEKSQGEASSDATRKPTRTDYNEADTPVPVPQKETISTRETMHLDDESAVSRQSALAQDTPVPDEDEEGEADAVWGLSTRAWAMLSIGSLVATFSLVGLLWLYTDTNSSEEPQEASLQEANDRGGSSQDDSEGSEAEPTARADEDEERGGDAEDEESDDRDDGRDEDDREDDEEERAADQGEEPAPAAGSASPPSRSDEANAFEEDDSTRTGDDGESERPRKLELDY
ncbi:MAG: serine/threonine-protein kinase [Persicimonas sp.]